MRVVPGRTRGRSFAVGAHVKVQPSPSEVDAPKVHGTVTKVWHLCSDERRGHTLCTPYLVELDDPMREDLVVVRDDAESIVASTGVGTAHACEAWAIFLSDPIEHISMLVKMLDDGHKLSRGRATTGLGLLLLVGNHWVPKLKTMLHTEELSLQHGAKWIDHLRVLESLMRDHHADADAYLEPCSVC
jgi:hypothetical protein